MLPVSQHCCAARRVPVPRGGGGAGGAAATGRGLLSLCSLTAPLLNLLLRGGGGGEGGSGGVPIFGSGAVEEEYGPLLRGGHGPTEKRRFGR